MNFTGIFIIVSVSGFDSEIIEGIGKKIIENNFMFFFLFGVLLFFLEIFVGSVSHG